MAPQKYRDKFLNKCDFGNYETDFVIEKMNEIGQYSGEYCSIPSGARNISWKSDDLCLYIFDLFGRSFDSVKGAFDQILSISRYCEVTNKYQYTN